MIAGPILGFFMAFVCGEVATAQDRDNGDLPMQVFEVGPSVYVRSLAIDRTRGSLWVGTSVGAHEIGLDDWQVRNTFTRKDGLANEYVFAVSIAPNGSVWFGTNAGGASRYQDSVWHTYFPMHGLADYWVYAFAFDENDKVWIGTWDGASHFDPATQSFTTYRDELVNIWVYGLDIDESGRIWFGTEGGVSMFDQGNWRAWTHEDGLGAPNYAALPPSENTGLGTRARHDLGILVGSGESYNPSYVFSVKVDNQEHGVWFGTWGGGISFFDSSEKWSSFTKDDGLPGNIVYAIAQSPDGTLWAGTNRGLAIFDGKTWREPLHGLPRKDVYAIAIENDKVAWLGLNGQVIRVNLSGVGG